MGLRADPTYGPTDLGERLSARALEEGVITRSLLGTAIQVSPPLVLTAAEIATLVGRLGSALENVAGDLGAGAVAS